MPEDELKVKNVEVDESGDDSGVTDPSPRISCPNCRYGEHLETTEDKLNANQYCPHCPDHPELEYTWDSIDLSSSETFSDKI